MRVSLGLLVLFFVTAPIARCDVLCLKDGRFVEGHKLTRAEKGIKIAYPDGEVFVPEELVGDVLIDGEPLAPPATEEEQAQTAKGMVRFEGKWMTPKSRDDLLKKRVEQKVKDLDAFKAHAEWRNRYKASSKNFEFEHTLQPEVFENYRDL